MRTAEERKLMSKKVQELISECPSLSAAVEVIDEEMDNDEIYDKQDSGYWNDEEMFMANLALQWLDENKTNEEFLNDIK